MPRVPSLLYGKIKFDRHRTHCLLRKVNANFNPQETRDFINYLLMTNLLFFFWYSEAPSSELLEIFFWFPRYYMDVDVISGFKYVTTRWCVTRRKRFN